MIKYALIVSIFCCNTSIAQDIDTTYYDRNWEETAVKDSIFFIGTKQKLSDSTEFIKDYYLNGVVQCTGYYTNGKRTGRWKYYYPDGRLKTDYEYNQYGNRQYFLFTEENLKPNEDGVYHTVNSQNIATLQDTSVTLEEYINAHFKLPSRGKRRGVKSFEGYYRLIIDEKGKLIAIVRPKTAYRMPDGKVTSRETPKIGHGIDEALEKFLLEMPDWKPATVMGKPVKSALMVVFDYKK